MLRPAPHNRYHIAAILAVRWLYFAVKKPGPLGPVEDPGARGSETVGFAKKMTWRVGDPVFSGIRVLECWKNCRRS